MDKPKKKSKKKRTLVVGNTPTLKPGKLYEGLIKHISDIDYKASSFHVSIENRDASQAGRIHGLTFSSQLFGGSQTDRFLTAAGLDVGMVGSQINLDDLVGVIIGMRFCSPDCSDEQIEFERIEPAQEHNTDDLAADHED